MLGQKSWGHRLSDVEICTRFLKKVLLNWDDNSQSIRAVATCYGIYDERCLKGIPEGHQSIWRSKLLFYFNFIFVLILSGIIFFLLRLLTE